MTQSVDDKSTDTEAACFDNRFLNTGKIAVRQRHSQIVPRGFVQVNSGSVQLKLRISKRTRVADG